MTADPTPTTIKLARELATQPKLKRIPGMLFMPLPGAPVDKSLDADRVRIADEWELAGPCGAPSGWVPDLHDLATVSCLLMQLQPGWRYEKKESKHYIVRADDLECQDWHASPILGEAVASALLTEFADAKRTATRVVPIPMSDIAAPIAAGVYDVLCKFPGSLAEVAELQMCAWVPVPGTTRLSLERVGFAPSIGAKLEIERTDADARVKCERVAAKLGWKPCP